MSVPTAPRVLRYRAGSYETFMTRMLAELQVQVTRSEGSALKCLSSNHEDNFAIALMKAWAVVGDILSFYQERIAEEGFLMSATEQRSWHYLARMVGVKPGFGVAASTWLSFSVHDFQGAPACITVPQGASIQSVPVGNQLPVIFETVETIEARSAWNSLGVSIPQITQPVVLDASSTELRLQGTLTGLKPGAWLFLADENPVGVWALCTVEQVEVKRPDGFTIIGFKVQAASTTGSVSTPENQSGATALSASMQNPRVFALPQQAALFGQKAPIWSTLSAASRQNASPYTTGLFRNNDAQKPWESLIATLPKAPLNALAMDGTGTLYAAAAGVLYRYQTAGEGWVLLQSSLLRKRVYSLHVDIRGYLFAGTIDGAVLRSTDQGNGWEAVTGDLYLKSTPHNSIEPPATLPSGPIRAICTLPWETATPLLLVGTDNGIFSTDFNLQWLPLNKKLPGYNEKTGLAELSILCLSVDALRKTIYAGSDCGIFRSQDAGQTWKAVNGGLLTPASGRLSQLASTLRSEWTSLGRFPKQPAAEKIQTPPTRPAVRHIYSICAFHTGKQPHLFAGTDDGLFHSLNEGDLWESVSIAPSSAQPSPVFSIHWQTGGPSAASYLLAGTQAGLFRSADNGLTWVSVDLPFLFNLDSALEPDLDRNALGPGMRAAFQQQGITLSPTATPHCLQAGVVWQIADPDVNLYFKVTKLDHCLQVNADQGFSDVSINAMASDCLENMALIAARPATLETEWPHFCIENNRIDLDRVYANLVTGSWVLLYQTSPSPLVGAYPIAQVSAINRSAYALNRMVTRLALDLDRKASGSPDLSDFNLRETQVLLQSRSLPICQNQSSVFEPVQGHTLYLSADTPPFKSGQTLLLTGQPVSLSLTGPLGGLYKQASEAADWDTAGLQGMDIRSIAIDPAGTLFVATEQGLFRRAAKAAAWTSITDTGSDLARQTVQCLLAVDVDYVLAGSTEALWRWQDTRWQPLSLSETIQESVLSLAQDAGQNIYAGCASGSVYRLLKGQMVWQSQCRIPNRILAIAASSSNAPVWLGTDGDGIFQLQGQQCQPWNTGLSNLRVQALMQDAQGVLYAGTAGGGVFQGSATKPDWTILNKNKGLMTLDIQALAMDAQKRLYCGSRGGGVFSAEPKASGWRSLPISLSNDVTALLVDPQNQLLAGTRRQSILRAVDGLTTQTLRPQQRGTLPLSFTDSLDQGNLMSNLREALALQQITVPVTARIQVLEKGRCWLLTAPSSAASSSVNRISLLQQDVLGSSGLAASTATPTPISILLRNTGARLTCYDNLSLSVSGLPGSESAHCLAWSLTTADGFMGTLLARQADTCYQPASAGDASQTEVATVFESAPDTMPQTSGSQASGDSPAQKAVRVTLQTSLNALYDPTNLTISGNVAMATHGQTVSFEVLGSGNAALSNQIMPLHKPPLTFVSAPNAQGAVSTLRIAIKNDALQALPLMVSSATPLAESGVAWQEVPTLATAGPESREYMVNIDDKGTTTVIFGDGQQGARLPSGRENVVANYRSGIGTAGNVSARTLTLLKNRPAGLQSVTNPLPATGGVDPGMLDTHRQSVPRNLQDFSRIVSIEDYQSFAQNFPGIGKATTTLLPCGHGRMVHITLAATDGSTLGPGDTPFDTLKAAIPSCRAYAEPFTLDSYRPLYFEIAAECLIQSGLDASSLQTAIEQRLRTIFSFDAMAFGQIIPASSVIARIQETPGVLSVSLSAFHLTGETPALVPFLKAPEAHWEPLEKQFIPASILLLNPQTDGLRLFIQETS